MFGLQYLNILICDYLRMTLWYEKKYIFIIW